MGLNTPFAKPPIVYPGTRSNSLKKQDENVFHRKNFDRPKNLFFGFPTQLRTPQKVLYLVTRKPKKPSLY
jgi:hypothetical protein